MKLGCLICSEILCLFLIGVTPMCAQDEEHHAQTEDKDKNGQGTDKKQDEKAQDKKDEKADKALNKDEHQDQMNKDAHQDQMKKAHADSRQDKQASTGGRIPEDKFHASFGRQHTFVMSKTVVVEHQTTFQQSGYSFVMAQPWPTAWVATTPVYIDFISGGYYLLCPAQPGIQISLSVVL